MWSLLESSHPLILRLINKRITIILETEMEGVIFMPQAMHLLLLEYLTAIQGIYGSHLKRVILYGSYARGDYTTDSDVDIMILVDLNENELDQYSDALSEIGFEYNVEHDIWMMPVVKNIEHFRHWVTAYPFYKNVQKEGVVLYEAA